MNWIDVNNELPEVLEDGEQSKLVLCKGTKGTHKNDTDAQDWTIYELMTYGKLDKPELRDMKGNLIWYGWSNRWWDTNPDLYNVDFWTYLD